MSVPGADSAVDLVVIGGGVNGTGIARDAAMRGLSVVLVEKRDWAAGSSGANSGMIHGGLRYLLFDRTVTYQSSLDSGYIQRIAPHLLFRIPFLFPLAHRNEEGTRNLGQWVYDYLTGVYVGAYDPYARLKNGKRHNQLTAAEALEVEPGLSPKLHSALTFDEHGIDPFRLCALNARSAADHGASLRTYTQVTSFLRGEGGRVEGVKLTDLHTNAVEEVRSKVVVNAAGPWAPRVARLANVKLALRPGKGVHLTLDRRLSNYAIACYAIDGRQIFVMPHESTTIIGTTDDDYYGDPDDIPITRDEVAYLLEGVARAFPKVREARVLRAWAGVRNTMYKWGVNEDVLSREHLFVDHAREGADGFYSLVGGKLASFRLQAEEAVDVVCRRLGRRARCRTHEVALPGGERVINSDALAEATRLPPYSLARLVYRHGAEALKIVDLAKEDPVLAAPVCPCEGTLGAELVFSIRHEQAHHLVDLRRRCRLAMGSCQGTRCIAPAAALLARERRLNADETHAEIRSLLDERWKGNRAVATGDGLAQAELAQGSFFTTGHLPDGPLPGPARR